jgi:cystathionine gamma-synthase
MQASEFGFSTNAIHAGEIKDAFGSSHIPLYSTTTFKFDSTADMLDVVEGRRPGGFYTRYGSNPTIMSLEAKLACLDSAEAAFVFGAGMGAISALFLSHGRSGIACLGDVYGGTFELLRDQLSTLGINARFLFADETHALPALLESGIGLVFLETPANPTLEVIDIRRVADMAHAHGALLAVDNTFATPVNQQPHALGADLVAYSATKYLGGHSDITAGVLTGSRALLEPVGEWRKNLGQILAPELCHLLARSLSTLAVRIHQHNAGATLIAEALCEHRRVRRVLYPGLSSFPGHAIAAAQMSGFGGMLTIEVDGSADDAARVAERLELFALAPSLGGVESLVSQPIAVSHRNLGRDERLRRGITDSMLRLSVGLEDPRDLIRDLEQSLASA